MFLLAQAADLSGLSSLLPILLVGVVFWFLMIRPQRKRQQERDAMLATVGVGDEVVTIGGIFGEVDALDDEWVDLLVGEDVVLRVSRGSIGRIATAEDQASLEAFANGTSMLDDTGDDDVDDGGDVDGDGMEDAWNGDSDGHRTEA